MKDFILNILFPKFCLNCKKEGSYLCEDCFSLIDIFEKQYPFNNLINVFCATNKDSFIIKRLINQFYSAKEIAEILSAIILAHLIRINKLDFSDYVLIPTPIEKKEIRRLGFSPQLELTKELSKILKIPIASNKIEGKKSLLVDIVLSEKTTSSLKEPTAIIVVAR